jgi:hypothetical protein
MLRQPLAVVLSVALSGAGTAAAAAEEPLLSSAAHLVRRAAERGPIRQQLEALGVDAAQTRAALGNATPSQPMPTYDKVLLITLAVLLVTFLYLRSQLAGWREV